MRRPPRTAIAALAAAVLIGLLPSAAADTGAGGPRIKGCPVFGADSWWNTDIRALPEHPRSAQWLAHMSTERDLHPDFGPSFGEGPDYGIPITVVRRRHPRVRVHFGYAAESDRVRYPLGADTRIEGGRNADGDRHAIVVDRDRCRLYETWSTRARNGRWSAGSGAVWSLRSHQLRPDGWTSADAAGLPILPGLLRWSEVRSGRVRHAIRFTTDRTAPEHLWPARHDAGSADGAAYPPMGARFRLRADFSTDGFSQHARTVIEAMKTYGLVLADNGSPWYFQGERNAHWPKRLIADLKRVPASAFVAVDSSSLMVAPDSDQARPPGS